MHNTPATSPSEPTPRPLLGDLRIQHTVMASVHLSYGDDLQMDWDGRGRLLVKVGPFPSYSLPGARPLQSTPCALGKMALCGRRRISFSSHSTPPEQGTGLSVCERLMSVSWVLLVGPGASSFWGLGIGADLQNGCQSPGVLASRYICWPVSWIKGCPWTLTVGSKGRNTLEHPAQTQYPPIQHLERASGGSSTFLTENRADACVGHVLWVV